MKRIWKIVEKQPQRGKVEFMLYFWLFVFVQAITVVVFIGLILRIAYG